MKKSFTLVVFCLLTVSIASNAQVELKEINGIGQKKFKDAPKRVFISKFQVLYQLLFSQSETSEGGGQVGGGQRGSVTAGLTLGVKGLSNEDLKSITNKLYTEYVQKYKDAGYEIISTDEAAGTATYEGYTKMNGGNLSEDQFIGYITSTPDDYQYLIKDVSKKGKEKTKFNGNKLSADLSGALVVNVTIVLPFVEDAESGASQALSKAVKGIAKIVVEPNLRIESELVGSFASAFDVNMVITEVEYFFAEMAIKPLANTRMQLKKDLLIPGVFEARKYKVAETASVDNWGTQAGTMMIFNVTDKYLADTQPVPCDNKKYDEAVYNSCSAYLNETFKLFISYSGK